MAGKIAPGADGLIFPSPGRPIVHPVSSRGAGSVHPGIIPRPIFPRCTSESIAFEYAYYLDILATDSRLKLVETCCREGCKKRSLNQISGYLGVPYQCLQGKELGSWGLRCRSKAAVFDDLEISHTHQPPLGTPFTPNEKIIRLSAFKKKFIRWENLLDSFFQRTIITIKGFYNESQVRIA